MTACTSLRASLTPSDSLAEGDLTEFIDQESAVIDQYLGSRYTTPISDTTALKTVKRICIDFVVYRVEKILKTTSAGELPDNAIRQDATAVGAFNNSMRLLKSFSSGDVALRGASRLSSTTKRMAHSPKKSTVEPLFKRDEKQW